MPESTIEPLTIEIDRIKNGIANILAHWDVQQIERTDEMCGKTQTIYTYEEQRLDWVLPRPMQTREEVEAYLAENEAEILDWAQGAKVSL